MNLHPKLLNPKPSMAKHLSNTEIGPCKTLNPNI